MDITFYSFNKRKNSTKKPDGSGDVYQCVLKRGTDVLSPVLEVRADVTILSYNYVYIPAFNRYYYISEVQSVSNNMWDISCRVDVLASWISDVKGQSVYASRSSAHYNTLLDDRLVVATKNYTLHASQGSISVLDGATHYCVNVVDASSPTGNRTFFDTSVASFIDEALNTSWYEDLFDKVRGFNPLDIVNEAYIVGMSPQACHTTTSATADLGTLFDSVTVSGSCIAPNSAIPRHYSLNLATSSSYADFRLSSKYVTSLLYLPCVGVINIPVELWANGSGGQCSVSIEYSADCITGALIYSVNAGGVRVGDYGTSLKAPFALAKQTSHAAQVGAGIIETIGGAALIASGAGAVVGAGALTKGIHDVASIIKPPEITRTSAISGSLAPLSLYANQQAVLIIIDYDSHIAPMSLTDIAGRPTSSIVTISGGYYQCADASISFAGTEREIDSFNALLNGGVYVE